MIESRGDGVGWPSAGDLLALQRTVGNRAVASALAGRQRSPHHRTLDASLTRDRVSIQRHSEAALEKQIEEAAEEEQHPVQRQQATASRAGARPRPVGERIPNLQQHTDADVVQRHAAPRNRPASDLRDPMPDEVPDRSELMRLMEWIIQEVKAEIRPKVADHAKFDASLVPAMCKVNPQPVPSGNIPAAADPAKSEFVVNIRCGYFYDREGRLDRQTLVATMVHEMFHSLSIGHHGLQEVEFVDPSGAVKKLSDAGPKNSLDEAMTDRLALSIYKRMTASGAPGRQRSAYHSNYWQNLREVGIHSTSDGLKLLMAGQFTERNWLGGLADVVVELGLMTQEQLDYLYLNGPAASKQKHGDGPLDALRARYKDVMTEWGKRQEATWAAALPVGVMTAARWVETCRRLLTEAHAAHKTPDEAKQYVSSRTGGHELVGADDPRSHLFTPSTKPRSPEPDDLAMLAQEYGLAAPGAAAPMKATDQSGWKGKAIPTKEVKADTVEKVRTLAIEQGRRLGLPGAHPYPHIVVPSQNDRWEEPKPGEKVQVPGTRADAEFRTYPVAVFNPTLDDISGTTMTALSGVDGEKSAAGAVRELGGGAYETKGSVVYSNSIEPRTLLHEIGHWKQDKHSAAGGFSEANVASKILEYHNFVMNENTYDDNPVTDQRVIRLSYTGKPMALKKADWATRLPDPAGAEPPKYTLLKHVAKAKELEAITEIEAQLGAAQGGDGHAIYSAKMKWYLQQELAREYFDQRYEV